MSIQELGWELKTKSRCLEKHAEWKDSGTIAKEKSTKNLSSHLDNNWSCKSNLAILEFSSRIQGLQILVKGLNR